MRPEGPEGPKFEAAVQERWKGFLIGEEPQPLPHQLAVLNRKSAESFPDTPNMGNSPAKVKYNDMYTVSEKKETLYSCPYLC